MRLGEIAALRGDDIDFARSQIRVDEMVTTVKTYKKEGPKQRLNWGTTKSSTSERTVVADILKGGF
jgi:integrase